MQRAKKLKDGNGRGSSMVLLQIILVPLISMVPVAAILIWGLGLEPSRQLTRGILYGWLFLICTAVGRWKFSLEGVGITGKNIRYGFLYAGIIFVISLAFLFGMQPPEGLVVGLPLLSPILFYLAVALAEEIWFRGLIFKALYDWKGAILAVFGSAILFGLMHVPMHGGKGLLFSLSIGLPYAVVRLKTNNILGLIVIHWLTNLTDNFIRLSSCNLELIWLLLLHILVFSGVSILILLLDRWLRSHRYISL